jgi:hypothetical protein
VASPKTKLFHPTIVIIHRHCQIVILKININRANSNFILYFYLHFFASLRRSLRSQFRKMDNGEEGGVTFSEDRYYVVE